MRRCLTASILALTVVMAWSSLASEDAHARPMLVKKNSWEIGLQLGGLFFLDNAAVPFDPEGPAYPSELSDTFAYTLTGTYNVTRNLGVELGVQFSPAEVNRLSIFSLHLDAIYYPFSHAWFVPFIGAGPSFVAMFPQDQGGHSYATDSAFGINALAGFKLYPWDHVGFRVDLRYLLRVPSSTAAADGREDVMGHDLILSFGLFGSFGGDEKKKPPVILDTDGDGILDNADACPLVPGQPTAQGCPDKDGDTLADDKDRCPDNAGPVATVGCPDKDGDTLVDIDDRCPNEAGLVEYKGCPDLDGDKIANIDDKCPKIPGVAEFNGCPPPPPEDIVKIYNGAIKGITFELDSDVIRKTSFKVLDAAVQVLVDYPAIRLMIEGHTSSEGTREHNLDLSDRRAKSVKAYFVSKGVADDRFDTKGFGPDVPVAPNNTEANRSKNRRIEFKIINPQ